MSFEKRNIIVVWLKGIWLEIYHLQSKIFNLQYLILLLLAACTTANELVDVEVKNVDVVAASYAGDKEVAELVAPYKSKLEAEMNEVIGQSAMPMEKAMPEGLLGNFVSDLVFEACKKKYKPADGKQPDFCLINNGGLRVPLPEGEITKGKIFELMPFENEIVIVTISGEKAKELFQYLAVVGGQPVSNITMGIRDTIPYNIMIGGKPFDEHRSYKVVTSDYLANGGDKMSFYLEPINRESIAYKIRDAIIDHVRALNTKGEKLSSQLDGRIYEFKP